MKVRISVSIFVIAGLMLAGGIPRVGAQAAPGANGDDPIRAAFQQSYALEKSGQYADAIHALAGVPKGYAVFLRTGWLSYLAKDYATADSSYQAANRAAPNSIESRLGAILPLLAEQRYADAELAARQVARMDPNNYYGNMRLSYALRWEGKFPAADEVASRMNALYPTDTSFLLELAYAKWGENLKPAAKKLFNQVLIFDPDNALATQSLAKL